MSLKLFMLSTTIHHPYNGAKIDTCDKETYDLLYGFFCLDKGEEKEIIKKGLTFVAQKGYTLKNIDKTDYIKSPLAFLFSERFVSRLGKILEQDMQFFPCTLICGNKEFKWYAARIKRRLPIIDEEASTYYEDPEDGERDIDSARYRTDITTPFFIAEDSVWDCYYAVSELFKELCEKNDILIEFDTPEILF